MTTWVIFHLREELSELIPVFLEFVEQMENQGKDWTLQVMILTTSGKNCHDLPRFSRVN